MQYVLAVYRSRNVAIRAYNYLNKRGETCALVSTPRAVGVGCGLSVKTSPQAVERYGAELASGESFVGFYSVKNTMRGSFITRI